MVQRLDELLQLCTVKITVPGQAGWGTGFFAAPGLILTCAHGVKALKPNATAEISWRQEGLAEAAIACAGTACMVELIPELDLALLRTSSPQTADLPCVYLDGEFHLNDNFYTYGYSDRFPDGTSVTSQCEGDALENGEPLILFKSGLIRPGLSGSPLLNLRTGKVCGMVKFTRDRSIDLGGGAIPSSVILQQFEALTDHQQAFHQQDARWSSLMPALVADFATISGIRERIEAATVTRGDLKILQQALQNKSQQAHQLSQYNITIGEINDGQNIQIGDRTYVEINDEAVQAIVAAIRQSLNLDSPLQRMGAPFQAPPLPSYYVDRPEVSQDLKARLLQPKAANGSAAAALMISAIHGLGAIGKSTLATALAHDPDVRRHFSDGILWVTLDQQPNLLELLQSWVRALGDHVFRVENEAAASRHLQTLLQDKAMLLVVDDAWSTADARHFVVNASRCQVLVTTRDASIAEGLRATNYPLDVMSPEQAMQLIARKLQQEFSRELQEQEREPAAALTKAVGYLPLALDLAVAQVATGRFSWDVLLQDLEKEVARLKSFDRPNTRDEKKEGELKQASLIASLNLSIQNLGSEDEREYFIWLGVLPKDAAFSSKLAVTLWNLEDERDAEDSLKYLRSKALLLPSVPLADGTLTYRLHDLIHDLACNLLEASPTPRKLGDLKGLGLKLAAAHAELLERYRQKTQNPLWHSLPNDGYIHERLVWHLERAGWVDEIHALLGETAETGRNGWYEARDRLGQTAGYISDVRQAWDLADRAAAESLSPQIMGWQCRYALITASLNSVSDIPGELLLALVNRG